MITAPPSTSKSPARIAAEVLGPRALLHSLLLAATMGKVQVGAEVLADLLVPAGIGGRGEVCTAVQVELDDALDPLVDGGIVERVALPDGIVVYAIAPVAMAALLDSAVGAALKDIGLELEVVAAPAPAPIPPHPSYQDRALERVERAAGTLSRSSADIAGRIARLRRRLLRHTPR